jgi:hypothetical protein
MLEGVEGGCPGQSPADSNGESAFDGSIHLSGSPKLAPRCLAVGPLGVSVDTPLHICSAGIVGIAVIRG